MSRKQVRLIREQKGLQVVKKQKKRRASGKSTSARCQAKLPNHVWSYDFISDQTADGRRIRSLTIIDENIRYCRSSHVGRSITSKQVKSVLQE